MRPIALLLLLGFAVQALPVPEMRRPPVFTRKGDGRPERPQRLPASKLSPAKQVQVGASALDKSLAKARKTNQSTYKRTMALIDAQDELDGTYLKVVGPLKSETERWEDKLTYRPSEDTYDVGQHPDGQAIIAKYKESKFFFEQLSAAYTERVRELADLKRKFIAEVKENGSQKDFKFVSKTLIDQERPEALSPEAKKVAEMHPHIPALRKSFANPSEFPSAEAYKYGIFPE